MKQAKKILAALLSAILLLGLASCSSREDNINQGIREAARDASSGMFDVKTGP